AGLNKVIALTENGPIPDIDSTFEDDAVWSFWMPWYDTWSGNFLSQTSETVWKKNLADDRVYKLENMPGWADYDVGISPASKVRSSAVTLSQHGRSLQLTVPSRSNVSLFSLQGKLVQNIGTNLSAGTHTVQLSKIPQGVYIVRVNGANFSATQKILVR
ncbi:MAG: T9SS type A sorting domain-containing protein, partial [Fibrobacter sp.]|nr:T9SS type A sorting domain-containing protein [Fibrobacter sp.]